MIIKAAHVILCQMFLCPAAIEAEYLNSRLLADLVPIEADIKTYTSTKESFDGKNYFLQDFGKIEIFAHKEISPFVLDVLSNESRPSKRKILSTCYGSRGNFHFYLEQDGVHTRILPIIHIFPNRMVNIMYSCYIKSDNNDSLAVPEIIRELKKSFLTDEEPYFPIRSSKDTYSFVRTFKDITSCICRKIEKVMPEYDFFDSDSLKHVFTQLLQTANINSQTDDFNEACFKDLAQFMLNKPKISDKHYSIHESTDWRWGRRYDYHLIYPHFYLSARNYAFTEDKLLVKQLRYYGWSLFRIIEFAVYDKLILQYIAKKSLETQTNIRKEKHRISLNQLRPNYYAPSIDSFCINQRYAFEQLDDFSRKLVYMYYGSKEKRNQQLENAIKEVEKSTDLIDSRENPWIKLFKLLLTK